MPSPPDNLEGFGPRLKVAVAGATGTVGQKLVSLLVNHPWFELIAVAASEKNIGRPYGEVVHWLEAEPLPREIAAQTVQRVDAALAADFVLSGLDTGAAHELEEPLARAGLPVISNAGAFRMDPEVPLVVPEVNGEHLELARAQRFAPGFIVTNPNCSVIGLVLALKPLADRFGLERVMVTTLQAVSGAGYPGVPSLDILGNVIPWISGEEEKIESEPRKILGSLGGAGFVDANFTVSAQANRVPVHDGHTLSVSVALSRRAEPEEVAAAFAEFQSPLAGLGLPSAPERPIEVETGTRGPQPRLHAGRGRGMTVTVGRIRRCQVLDVRFVALVHNTLRGAAGGALLNAELLARQGMLGRRGEGRV